MNPFSIQFRCPSCAARIKAPLALVGESRDCPGCGESFTVPHPVRPDSGPILVLMDDENQGFSRMAPRRSA